ncbi:2-C-methyl-D-erythritol 2,4-cyclodiphosphate synthase [Treponema sp.]|uniref:2-C-methyl-D-erythritol 2,4-cyclodiphosphate synthase n=1 Tax=Treponema sp. TaxID=166 RepID=UPI00389036EE
MKTNRIALIIVAAGSSSRMGGQIKKEYLSLNGGTVLSEVARIFLLSKKISSITVICPVNGQKDSEQAFYKDEQIKKLTESVPVFFVEGGATRAQSVYNGLSFLESEKPFKINSAYEKPEFVLIHDGARPFLSIDLVEKSIASTIKYGASVPAINTTDTQKEVDENGFIKRHLIRNSLKSVQTPQGFIFDEILSCHKKALDDKTEYTDDTEIFDRYSSKKTFVFEGELNNKKITYPKDLEDLSFSHNDGGNGMIHTGMGYDKHRLVENRKLMLGGIEVPFEKGEDGHSDGDAVLHAVTDALLGASHLGDIGSYFPDTDPAFKDADSKKLLSIAWNDVKKEGWSLENLDIVILLEKPKFISYRDKVISSIADILGVTSDKVFVKAKTGEKTGDVGEGKVIEVFANCLLKK